MHSKFFLLFISFTSILWAQTPENNNSLLWEISGNGLTKPSYLYGTMHVSNKIAFRLDDVFYEALDNAEYVALESDPNLWLDYYIENENTIDFSNLYKKGFYNEPFVVATPKPQAVYGMLGFNGQVLNNILYRTNVFSQDFQEETYLDMFIYQTAKKFDKVFLPLEDMDVSNYMVQRSQENMMREEPETWLVKRLEKDSYANLLENAYRERNIAFIDSLNQAFYSDNHLKYMLYERNKIMANGITKSAQKGSTFSGIGAAHLGGEQGVIQLLKDKGFTVTPLQSDKTNKAKNLKTKFEDTFNVKSLVRDTITDALFSVKLPNKLYHFGSYKGMSLYASPDLTNGAFFTVARISTFPYLKEGEQFSLETLEDMFFESIPGTIVSKKKITNGGYDGIDMTNKLKNGDFQRYHIYKTPLEIVIVKLGGKKDFTQQYSDAIFNSIEFKKEKEWQSVTNTEHSFEVKMPANSVFYNSEKSGRKLIQGVDNNTNVFYLFERNTLNDLEFIEEDAFELQQIQTRFYENLDLDATYDEVVNGQIPSLVSSAEIDSVTHQKIYVKTALHKGNYFVMAAFGASKQEAENYFNSLHITNPSYTAPFEQVVDTSLYFSTISNVKMPPADNKTSYKKDDSAKKEYAAYTKTTSYLNANDEKIVVTLNKLHDLRMFENIDSLWSNQYKTEDYETFIKKKTVTNTDAFGNPQLLLTLGDTLSARTIYIKSVLKNGAVYELKTIGDTLGVPSKFVADFYNHFQPKDSVIGVSPLVDKTTLFYEKLRANDSIVFSGISKIRFAENDFDSLQYYIEHFDFPEDKKFVRDAFISEIAHMNNPKVESYLKYLYANSYEDSTVQELILNAVASQKNKKAVDQILDFLAQDFPVDLDNFMFFYVFSDTPELSKAFFPELLDYTSIEEYKRPIYTMLSELVARKKINPKIYKHFVNQLLNEGKIELKKQLSSDKNATNNRRKYFSESTLKDYVTLLYPYRKQKKVAEFIDKLDLVTDATFNINYLVIQKKFGEKVTPTMFLPYAKDLDSRSYLVSHLKNNNAISLMPTAYFNNDSIAVAELYRYVQYKKGISEYEFIAKKQVTNKEGSFDVYVYKVNNKRYNNEDNWELKAIVPAPLDEKNSLPLYQKTRSFNKFEAVDDQVNSLLEEIRYIGRERVQTRKNNYANYYGY